MAEAYSKFFDRNGREPTQSYLSDEAIDSTPGSEDRQSDPHLKGTGVERTTIDYS